MRRFGKLEYYWVALIAITFSNTILGEGFDSTVFITTFIALTVMYKGLVVIDHFMELKDANKYLRLMMRTYFFIFPSLIIVSGFF
ncbi:cytochrome C oxidase subunit IV family protein [Thalassotalea psychrophila]|uniref:Cytochrome C oxidase subunit IV family protein n=1 Tax=Thalassotalea psychrophila TaxID=3065647 RepID=A0ABY9TXZ5_9GAMM|nr:cytochrome C oxidase subunit IV family protein [Colwelliaceae bacterium SQ149]